MQSMTGFGRGAASNDTWHATVEVSTVNRKQAEVVVQAPRELLEIESRIRKATLDLVSRGRAQISITLERRRETAPQIQVDAAMAKALHQAFAELGQSLGKDLSPTAGDYLRQSGIVTVGEREIDPEAAWQVIEPAMTDALTALVAMRSAEGAHLKDDFLGRLNTLGDFAAQLAADAPGRGERQRELLFKRLRDASLDLNLDDERVLRELALFADRCDISEELTRLSSHFAKFREYLDSAEPCGRPLDFLCQELFREFNTIGSKANDAGIAQTVVEAKTELEKIREQVQNIE